MISLDKITTSICNSSLKNMIDTYDQYSIGKTSKRSVNVLIKLSQDELKKDIKFFEVDDSSHIDTIKGLYFSHTDSTYTICIKSELNNCWKRLVLCKELFHVIFDNPEYKMTDIDYHVGQTISTSPNMGNASPVAIQHEFLAEYAAMEFLFPFKDRLLILANSEKVNYVEIAERYKVPRIFIERYLSDEYMKIVHQIKDL